MRVRANRHVLRAMYQLSMSITIRYTCLLTSQCELLLACNDVILHSRLKYESLTLLTKFCKVLTQIAGGILSTLAEDYFGETCNPLPDLSGTCVHKS